MPNTSSEMPLTPSQRWRAYGVCIAVAALTILDLTKINVALPAIEESLDSSSTELKLLVSGYVLTFGLMLVPAGRLGDQRSRRLLFIIGLSVFGLMSLVCALAPTSEALLVARLLQGLGAGMQMPQAIGLIQTLFQGAERAKALGGFGVTIGITLAVGPTLGGLIILIGGATEGWRGIFWMNVPLTLIAIALAVWALPATEKKPERKIELDPVGLLLLSLTVLALMVPFLFTTGSPEDNSSRWWLLVIVLVLAGLFAAWEQRYAASGRRPILVPRLFRLVTYRNGMLLASAYFASNPSLLLLTSLYLQLGVGLEPVYAGMVSISFALLSAVTAWYGGRLIGRIGRPLVVWGLVLVLTGVGLLVLIAFVTPPELTPWVMAAAMAVAGLGGGFVITPNQTLTLEEVPVQDAGLAGSLGQLGQRIGGAVGMSVSLSFFYSSIYRETGSGTSTDLAVYQHAYGYGMLAVAAFFALALVMGLADLNSRRRDGKTD